MNWKDYIIADPEILVGKPVIKGTRLSVDFIIRLLAQGWSERSFHLGRGIRPGPCFPSASSILIRIWQFEPGG